MIQKIIGDCFHINLNIKSFNSQKIVIQVIYCPINQIQKVPNDQSFNKRNSCNKSTGGLRA